MPTQGDEISKSVIEILKKFDQDYPAPPTQGDQCELQPVHQS